ncbi:MAG: phosphatidylserine decarboxylase [Firmicutes bacterium]|nr:phosphatidylserine decarboxylase [Bacillota bacterium]
MLNLLYKTKLGRIILRPLVGKWFSSLGGFFMDSSFSKLFIKSFIKNNNIDTDEYILDNIGSFNDFFTRKIKPERRPLDTVLSHLISPCDGKLTIYRITDDLVIPLKQSRFSINSLLSDETIADKYRNGYCFVFRLTVDDYHRYSYVETGNKSENIHIPGKYHTVRPIALEEYPVFIENTREYTIIETTCGGDIAQIEVGAMLVGKIDNYEKCPAAVVRGHEKGRFLFGGSTIILLFEPNRIMPNSELIDASRYGIETPVKLGQKIGAYNL